MIGGVRIHYDSFNREVVAYIPRSVIRERGQVPEETVRDVIGDLAGVGPIQQETRKIRAVYRRRRFGA